MMCRPPAATVLLLLIGLAVPAMADVASASAPQGASSERTITGVWRTLVTPVHCETSQPLAPPLQGLFTFHEGGTMSEYGVPAGSSPALRSPGHGIWRREHGWQQYSFGFVFNRYDMSGAFLGLQRISGALELDASGDRLTTTSQVQVLDGAANVLATFCATAAAVRFED
jgi:hypothetical protein